MGHACTGGRVVSRAWRFLIAGLTIGASSCSPAPPNEIRTAPPENALPENVRILPPLEAQIWLQDHPAALVIDAREDVEFREHGRLPKAVNLSALGDEAVLDQIDSEDRQRPVFIYCALGGRSIGMAERLREKGFHDLQILKGGLHGWKDAGLPTLP